MRSGPRPWAALNWPRSKFALQLTGILLLVSILPLLVYVLVSYQATERTILELASRQSLQTLHNEKDYLLLQMNQIESLAANLSQVDEINAALAKSTTSGPGSTYDTLATKARIGYLLSNYRNLNGLVSIEIFGLNGAHYHVGDTLAETDERSDLRNELWDRTIRSGGSVTWDGVEDNVQKFSSSQKVLVATKILVSSQSSWLKSEPIGMLLINYSTDYLHEQLSAVNSGHGAYLLVLDDRGRLIYHPDKQRIGAPVTKAFSELLAGASGSFTQRLGAQEVLLSYERIPEKNWVVVSVIPQQTLLAPLAYVRHVAVVMLAVMIGSILLLLQLFGARVVGPVADVAEGFKRFQLHKIAPGWRMRTPKSLEPIADLVQGFNTFLESMERRQESETRLRIAATAFESQEGMFVTDAQGVILQVNSALTSITGYPAAEAIGRRPSLFTADPGNAEFFANLGRELKAEGSWRGEVWNRRKQGELYPGWLTVTSVKNEDRLVTHYVATLIDITERNARDEEIKKLAFYDPLTGLPNRRLLNDRLQRARLECSRRRQSVVLMLLDLDKFKLLNDTMGHDIGDALLRQVAQRLTHCVREVDTVARLGGDEFVVLIGGLGGSASETAAHAEAIAVKLLRALSEVYDDLGGKAYQSTSSIGITIFSDAQSSLEDLMKQADIALYQAKEAGRNTLRFFDPDMQARVMARAALEQSIRQGLNRNEFKIHFQPKVDLDRNVTGAEALVRWQHPERGIVMPSSFIALAEETGLIVQLGQWVLRQACLQLVAWARQPERRALNIAVNVSPREFRQPLFVAQVLGIIDETGADPEKLTIEITESLLVENVMEVVEKMTLLRQRGISFALDDFGTGYSSLAYLKRMPLRELKIDRSFVRDVLSDANDATIARAVIALGQELGLEVVAEGVESDGQLEFLVAGGCKAFQGYLFSAPLAPDEFERFLDRLAAGVALEEG